MKQNIARDISEKEEGVLLVFRQEQCPRNSVSLRLPFAEAGDCFSFTDEDSGDVRTSEGGITLGFETPRSAKLIWIKKV